MPELSEGAVAQALVGSCPEGALLVVGNSTPVRDLDTFCAPSSRVLRVIHQRGASGIDGLVSGAAGAASVDGGPVALLLGDISSSTTSPRSASSPAPSARSSRWS